MERLWLYLRGWMKPISGLKGPANASSLREESAVNYWVQVFVYGQSACFRIILLMCCLADLTLELSLNRILTVYGICSGSSVQGGWWLIIWGNKMHTKLLLKMKADNERYLLMTTVDLGRAITFINQNWFDWCRYGKISDDLFAVLIYCLYL